MAREQVVALDVDDWATFEKARKLPRDAKDILLDFASIHENVSTPHMVRHVRRQYATRGRRSPGGQWETYRQAGERKYMWFKEAVVDANEYELLRWEPGNERLYPSLLVKSHPDHVRRIRGASFQYGTRVPYANRLFQQGGTNPFGESYPPRAMLEHTRKVKIEYQADTIDYVAGRLEAAGYEIDRQAATQQAIRSMS